MRNKNLLLKFKKKYEFPYIYIPLIFLSILSIIMYILKFCGFEFADDLFCYAVLILMSLSYFINCNNSKQLCIAFVILIISSILYITAFDDISLFIAQKCEKNGIIFGVFNTVFNTFSIDDLENLIYHTSYGGSKFINSEIVTGAVDIYNAKKGTAESEIYLCGKYLTLFCAAGIGLSFKRNNKKILIILLAAILTGNVTPFLLLLLFNFTPYYFLHILFVFLSYFIADFAGLKSGFYCNGSIIELFVQGDNLIYILAIGFFMLSVSYYASRLVKEKLKW